MFPTVSRVGRHVIVARERKRRVGIPSSEACCCRVVTGFSRVAAVVSDDVFFVQVVFCSVFFVLCFLGVALGPSDVVVTRLGSGEIGVKPARKEGYGGGVSGAM